MPGSIADAPKRRFGWNARVGAVVVVGLGLALRIGWLAADPHPAAEYGIATPTAVMAQQVERGRGFVVDRDEMARLDAMEGARNQLVDPVSPSGATSQWPLQLPGLPAVVASVWRISGDHYLPVLVLMALLDTLNVALLVVVGKRLLGSRLGLLAAGLYAVFPLAIDYSHTLTDATPMVTVVLLCILVTRGVKERRWWHSALLFSVIGGMGAYVRSTALVFAVAAAVGCLPLLGWRRGMALTALTAGGAYALFLPWVVRDAVELHAVLLDGRTGLGQTLYEGIGDVPNPYVDNGSNGDQSALRVVRQAGITAPYGSPTYDDYLRSRFGMILRTSPTTVARAFLRHAEGAVVLYPRDDEQRGLAALTGAMAEGMALLSFVGIAIAVGERRWALTPLVTVGLAVVAVQIPVVTQLRFGVPIAPIQALLTASVVARLSTRRSEAGRYAVAG